MRCAQPSTCGFPRPYSAPPMYVSVNHRVKLEPFRWSDGDACLVRLESIEEQVRHQ